MGRYLILVINPGSTSTKLALYSECGPMVVESLDHTGAPWMNASRIIDQLGFRVRAVRDFLTRHGVEPASLSCIVARGGLLRPVRSGTYRVSPPMLSDLMNEVGGSHASNLGALIAWEISDGGNIPAYIVDPVAVDEYGPLARLSGFPDIPRRSLLHALNMKASARKAARDLGRPLEELYLVIAHLGSGFSISPCYRGFLRDANNSNEEGPFTVERAGTLPSMFVLSLYRNSSDARALKASLTQESGMFGYLGTKDARKVEAEAARSDFASAVWKGMAYQVAKEIGAMAACYPDPCDAIVITGGLARSTAFVDMIVDHTSFLGRHLVYPGEDEMEALADGALRVVKGVEEARDYPDYPDEGVCRA